MKFHLPPSLRKALLTCLAAVAAVSAPLASSIATGSFAFGLAGYAMIASEAIAEDSVADQTDTTCYTTVKVDGSGYTGDAPTLTIDGVEYYVKITSPQGDAATTGTTTYYCTWASNGTLSVTGTEPVSYDFTASLVATDNVRLTDSGNADHSFIGITTATMGGAIYFTSDNNKVTGDFIGNSATAYGGAIYLSDSDGNEVTGDFIGNSATGFMSDEVLSYGYGGAIYLIDSDGNEVTGDFIGNSASCGGAIFFSSSNTNEISGDFIGNSATVYGGAIYLSDSDENTVTGDFIGNSTQEKGGAIYFDSSDSNEINGDFIDNSATYEGGAIYLTLSDSNTVSGDFIGNTSESSGGAIYFDKSKSNEISGDFIGNSASTNGGAIYLIASELTLLAASQDITFTDNTVTYGRGEAIYMTSTSTVTMYAGADYSITFNDTIVSAASGDTINIGGIDGGVTYDGTVNFNAAVSMAGTITLDKGTLALGHYGDSTDADSGYSYGSITGGTLVLNGGSLDLSDGEVQTSSIIDVDTLTINADISYSIDIDLSGGLADMISATSVSGTGKLILDDINWIGSLDVVDSVSIAIAEANLSSSIELDSSLTSLEQDNVLYELSYSYETDGIGYLTLTVLAAAYSDYELVEDTNTNAFVVTTADGSQACLVLDGVMGDLGGDTTYYYTWVENDGVMSLTVGSADSCDIIAQVDYTDNVRVITGGDINHSFIGITGAFNGGAIYFSSISDCKVTGDFIGNSATNQSYGAGGAIYLNGSTGNEVTGDFIGNFADGSGGAIYCISQSNNNEITGDFIGNSASYGGAIYFNNSSNNEITGDFIGNSAGGDGGAITFYNESTDNVITGDFIGNTATAGGYGSGGAIYFSASSNNEITGDFIGNFADGSGGAIYFASGSTDNEITGDFTDNSSGGGGGAIYFASGSTDNEITGNFTGNSASTYGGAIYLIGSELTLLAESQDITFTDNTADTAGEAIYMKTASTVTMYAGADYSITFNDTIVSANANDSIVIGGTIDDVTYDGTVNFNAAVSMVGTIKLDSGTLALGHYGDSTDSGYSYGSITGGTLELNGGSLDLSDGMVQTSSIIAVTTLTINSNISYSIDIDLSGGSADMISATAVSGDYKLILDDINLIGSLEVGASASIAIAAANLSSYIELDSSLTSLEQDNVLYELSYSYETDGIGYLTLTVLAAAYSDYELVEDTNTNAFVVTTADGSQACLVLDGVMGDFGGDTTKYYTWVKDETTGVMSLTEGSADSYDIIAQVDDADNKRDATGGTIDHSFIGLTSDESGGAICLIYSAENKVTGDFIGNSTMVSGGAIYLSGSDEEGESEDNEVTGDFIGNTAASSGGAIYFYNSSSNEVTGDFIGNSASFGGAIEFYISSTSNTVTGDFVGNSASYGGAISVKSDSNRNTVIGDFIGNTATSSGGAIYIDGSDSITVSGDFISNSASTYGGAISFSRSDHNEISGDFIGNSASTYGGAIYLTTSELTLLAASQDITFTDNTAGTAGEAIYMTNASTVTMYAGADYSITFNDTIVSDGSGDTINIGSDTYTGTVVFNEDVSLAGSLNVVAGTLNLTSNCTLTVGSTFSNTGSITGDGDITLNAATTNGGDIQAASLTVEEGDSTFGALDVATLNVNGTSVTLGDGSKITTLATDSEVAGESTLITNGTVSITDMDSMVSLSVASGTTSLDGATKDTVYALTIAEDAILSSTGDLTITGALDNAGTLSIAGDLTVTTVTNSGDLTVGEGSSIVNLLGSGTTTITGDASITEVTEASLNITAGTTSLDGSTADSLVDVTLATGATLSSTGDLTITGALDNAGTLSITGDLTLETATLAGGDIVAASLTVEEGENSFGTLNIEELNVEDGATLSFAEGSFIGTFTGMDTLELSGTGTTVSILDNATLELSAGTTASLIEKLGDVSSSTVISLASDSTLNYGTAGTADDLIFYQDELTGSGALVAGAEDTVIFAGENITEGACVASGSMILEADCGKVSLGTVLTDSLIIGSLAQGATIFVDSADDGIMMISTDATVGSLDDIAISTATSIVDADYIMELDSISDYSGSADGTVSLTLSALTDTLDNGNYNVFKTSGDLSWSDFSFSDETWANISALASIGQAVVLTSNDGILGFTVQSAGTLSWYTSSDEIKSDGALAGVAIFKSDSTELSSQDVFDSVDYVKVDADVAITLHDYDTSDASGNNIEILNLTGDADKTMSITGDGIDEDVVALINTVTTAVNGTLDVTDLTLRFEDAGTQKIAVDTISLTDAKLDLATGNALDLSTLVVNGDSELSGELSIEELSITEDASLTGGTLILEDASAVGIADSATLTDVTLVMADADGQLSLNAEQLSAVTLTGSVGTIALSNAAGCSIGAINTTGTDIDLGLMSTTESITLNAASSISNSSLTMSYDTQSVLSAMESGTSITIFSGEAVTMSNVAITINQENMSESLDLDYSKLSGDTSLTVFVLSDNADSVYEDVTAEFGGDTFYAMFSGVQFENGVVTLTLRSDSYDASTYTENGTAGALMLNDVVRNSVLSSDSDLTLVLQSMDALSGNGKNAKADALAAAISGATTTSLNAAQMGDMERNLRSLTSRNKLDSINFATAGSTKFSAWVAAEGGNYDLDTHSTYAGTKLNNQGGSVGVDAQMSENFNAGLAFSAMVGDLSSTAGYDTAEGDMDNLYVSLYANYSSNAWTHTFAMSMGMTDASLDRTVSHNNGSYKTKGDTDGISFALAYEVSYDIALNEEKSAIIRPILNATLISSQMDGYTEKGSDAALRVSDQENLYATFGAGIGLETGFGDTFMNRMATLSFRALVKADVGNRTSEADVTLISGSGYTDTVKGNEPGKVGIEFGAGLALPASETSSIFMNISLDFREDLMSLNGGMGYKFSF